MNNEAISLAALLLQGRKSQETPTYLTGLVQAYLGAVPCSPADSHLVEQLLHVEASLGVAVHFAAPGQGARWGVTDRVNPRGRKAGHNAQ